MRVRGVVLRLRGLGESDLLVDLFSRGAGRLTAVAKGGRRSKRRFFGLLLSAHILEAELAPTKSGDLWRLSEASLIERHLGLRADFRRWLAAGPVLELLLRATAAHDPHPAAFDLAAAVLGRLAAASRPNELSSALVIFLARLGRELGYGLELGRCVRCGRPAGQVRQPRLSPSGGLVCEPCAGGPGERPVAPGTLLGLAAALSLEPAALLRLKLTKAAAAEAWPFLARYWQDIAGRDLPSLGVAAGLVA